MELKFHVQHLSEEPASEADSHAHYIVRLGMILLLLARGAINYADKAVLGSHRWQRIGDVLRLIQPGPPLESNMQRDMKCDVTCCTVTCASLLAILCLASERSENTRFTDKRIEQHQLVIQRSEGRFTPLSLSAATRVSEKAETHWGFLS